ncbi:hydrogenase (NiFe) small subunit HydA [Thioploca ingrica]|uniref:hydrogenase (acceptor) n=1 Tax=Thioploca ingrica TaxID=40754 RepID=A0A090AHJ5_9GAMM|nr:hydrogenase (NiFe) small subunit HydA [Thioploca ingrica]
MSIPPTISQYWQHQGMSRRDFLQFCAMTAAAMALPITMVSRIAAALENQPRPATIWLNFQDCTGCTESMMRADAPSLERLLFDLISLDYHHTLQAAAGESAELARTQAMVANEGNYLLIVEGSIPTDQAGYATTAGVSNQDLFIEAAENAKAIIAIGTCASYGGIARAYPNPTGAKSVGELLTNNKPLINIPGCPPLPVAITGVIVHFLTFGEWPLLDNLQRPLAFFGRTVHDRCSRRAFYEKGLFASRFDDPGAKTGWCLYQLGCKGPFTYNACATTKWNDGVSFPMEAGHGCLGCSQPYFWDNDSFYRPLS